MLSYLSLFTKLNTKFQKTSTPLQAHVCGIIEKDKRVCLNASLTIEAALGLPLILFSMIILMIPLRIMDADRQMQIAAESVVTDVSRYMYTVNEIREGKQEDRDGEADEYMNLATDAALGAFAAARAGQQVEDRGLNIINFLDSEFMRENDMIVVKLDYEYKLPFPVLRLGTITQETVAARRAWTGKDGSGGSHAGDAEAEDDEIVYIGKNPTRYHLSPSCHYLSNSWSTVTVNGNGRAEGRTPCDRCGRAAVPGQQVYVTPEGEKFHTDVHCTAMQAFPQAVRKSTVEHLGCCSYCCNYGGK